MVENQHSINNILSFGAKSVNPKILEQLLIGRENTVQQLYKAVEAIALHRQNQFILTIAQRGMGKTHLIRVLFHRIQPLITSNKIVVAYFSEEEYGVANYFDFLLRIINSLMKWNENDKKKLQDEINKLIETPVANRENFAKKIIDNYLEKRPLLILVENFADILEGIKPKEQSKLRAWLYDTNYVSIIATSQAVSKDFEREDRPFYGFFTTSYLKKLTYQNSVDFLILLAKIDKRDDVIDFIKNKGAGQIKALHSLVKGNHRLLVTFYQFLKSNTLSSLSEKFIKTINDLKPYYETYIRNLPAQQQKVLRYIALNRKPIQGIEISKNCFIDQNTLTKQLSELIKKHLVEAIQNPNDKRNKLYDIDEPLLRISIEVGEHKEGITAIFIDFLAIYYDENQLFSKKQTFENLLKNTQTLQERTKLSYEIKAIDKALLLKKTEYAGLDEKDIQNAIEYYLANNTEDGLYDYLIEEDFIYNKENYFVNLGYYYHLKKKYNLAINHFTESEKINPKNEIIKTLLGISISELANINSNENLYIESFKKFKSATEINPKNDTIFYTWGIVISELANINSNENLFIESFEKFKIATKINPKNDKAFYQWGKTIGQLMGVNKNYNLIFDFNKLAFKAINLNSKDKSRYEGLLLGLKMAKAKDFSLKNALEIINLLSKNNFTDLINQWILFVLENYKNITKTQLNTLSKIAQKHKEKQQELIITENYINIYKRYIVEKDKKAIYDLPKEQRLFFMEHILTLH